MSFEEIAPGIVVGGYLLVVLLCVIYTRVKSANDADQPAQVPQSPPVAVAAPAHKDAAGNDPTPESADGSTNSNPNEENRPTTTAEASLLWAAWLLGIGTTAFWIWMALGWMAVLITFGGLIGLFVLIIAVVGIVSAIKGTDETESSEAGAASSPGDPVNAGDATGYTSTATTPSHEQTAETAAPRAGNSGTDRNSFPRGAKIFWSVVGGVLGAVFLWFGVAPPTFYFTGLGERVTVHTKLVDVGPESSLETVQVYYVQNGTKHFLNGSFGDDDLPDDGHDTVEVTIVSLWPGHIYPNDFQAWLYLAMALAIPVMGVIGVGMFIFVQDEKREVLFPH